MNGRPHIARSFATLVLASIALMPLAETWAQLPSHAYVPVEDWSMSYLEHLIRRRVIPDPTPLVRPFTVKALQRSLASVDSTGATPEELRIVGRLLARFAPDEEWVGLTVEADGGVWAGTHARRNSNLRESGDGHAFPRIGVNGILQAGVAAVIMHPEFDPNFKYDPDYGGKDVSIKVYYPEAYIAFRSKYLEVDLGRLRRSWGPISVPTLLVSSVPYPYDQFYLKVGTDRAFGHFLLADLDPMVNADGELSNRYFAAHRISARPWDFLDISAWGGQIISAPGQHWELWFVNPVPVYAQSRDEQNRDSNVLIGGDGELRLGNFRVGGSLSLDDLQLIESGGKSDEPPSYALSGVIDWSPGLGVYSFAYSRISNLSYRAHDPSEPFLIDQNLDRDRVGAGLATNFTDYDLLTVRGGFIVSHGILIKPELSLLRQGEGDLRQPFPPRESYPDLPVTLTGTVETTLRAAVQGTIAHPAGIHLSFDAGVHQISDYQHVEGASKTKFVGTVHLRYMIGTALDLD
jgi:hypothetical protein